MRVLQSKFSKINPLDFSNSYGRAPDAPALDPPLARVGPSFFAAADDQGPVCRQTIILTKWC